MGLDINSFTASFDKASSEYTPSAKSVSYELPLSMREDKSPQDRQLEQEVAASVVAEEPVADETPVATEESVAEEAEEVKPQANPTRFSVLARKEAELNRQRQKLREEKAEIERAAQAAREFEEKKARAKLNPIDALKDLGLTYEQVSEFVVNDNKPTVSAEVQAIRDEIQRLREEQQKEKEESQRIAQERLQQEQEQVIENFNNDVINHVVANPQKYEFTLANDAAHYVPEIIEKHFLSTGELLSVDKAAEIVESHFEEIANKVAQAAKFRERLLKTNAQSKAPATTPASVSSVAPAKKPVTLSNAMTASSSSQVTTRRTEQDRIRAALAHLDGK